MAIVERAWRADSGTNTVNISITVPTGIQANDVIVVAIMFAPTASSISPPNGYTEEYVEIVNIPLEVGVKVGVFTKISTGNEGSTHTWSTSLNTTWAGVMRVFTGVNLADIFDVPPDNANPPRTFDNTLTTTGAAPSITLNNANSVGLTIFASPTLYTGEFFSGIGNSYGDVQQTSLAAGYELGTAIRAFTASGSTGSTPFTQASSAEWFAMQIALNNGLQAPTLTAFQADQNIEVTWLPIYNVMDAPYSAHANDTDDDVSHIQAAVDAAYNAGGGIVFLPEGNYYLHAPHTLNSDCGGMVELKDNVYIMGEGINKTIIRSDYANTHPFVSLEATDIGISHMKINCTASGQDGIKFYASSRIAISYIESYGSYNGMNLAGCSNVTIRNCTAHDVSNIGISLSENTLGLNNPEGLWCHNNIVYDSEAYACAVRGFAANGQRLTATYPRRTGLCSFIRCNSHENTGAAFFHSACGELVMEDCTASGNTNYNVGLYGVSEASISNTDYSGTGGTRCRILHASISNAIYFTNSAAYTQYGDSGSDGVEIIETGAH